ncbi:MAG: hypothetical protein M1839_002092 [Geoglossum umbratile]|nr:MAG: hypothetical protein M1839_002092 [Geoglossum umbratile]
MDVEFTNDSCTAANAILSCRVHLPEGEEVGWTDEGLDEKTIFSSFAWLTERVRHIGDFGTWRPVELPREFGRCQKCAPGLPKAKFWERSAIPGSSPHKDPVHMSLPADYFVFSTDIRRYNYGEQRPIVARLDPVWGPLRSPNAQTVRCTTDGQVDIKSAKLKAIALDARATYATPHPDMDVDHKRLVYSYQRHPLLQGSPSGR